MAVNQGGAPIASGASGMIDTVKQFFTNFDLKQWAEKIGGSSAEAIQAAVYFGLCFAIGFLFKKHFKHIFMCLVFSAFVVLGLDYLGMIMIDWPAIKAALGISAGVDLNILVTRFFDWVKEQLLLFIASVVGFFVGYKLG
ncbi:hypothetical protein FJ365_01980 [Candidatus Dependentiae bacterium]|nr:hypothetical protein [Candidatus Dependentiae bacterium]